MAIVFNWHEFADAVSLATFVNKVGTANITNRNIVATPSGSIVLFGDEDTDAVQAALKDLPGYKQGGDGRGFGLTTKPEPPTDIGAVAVATADSLDPGAIASPDVIP